MKIILTTSLLILFTSADLTRAGEKSRPLFNGKDLEGWQGMQGKAGNWGVKAGVLAGTGGKGSKWLATTGEYGDFELSLEYKLPKNGKPAESHRATRIPQKVAGRVRTSRHRGPADAASSKRGPRILDS